MSQKLKRYSCPQCGAGDESGSWLDTNLILCCHCGLFADISKIASTGEFDTTSPWYALKVINKRNLAEHVYTVPGLGIICIQDRLQLFEKGTRREDVVRRFDRLESSGATDMGSSYITRAKGDKVVFVRGRYQYVINYLDLYQGEYPKLLAPSGNQYKRIAINHVNVRHPGLRPLY